MLADFQTNNPIFGRTNNPWNVERTPGGSSGGAAAALSSGMTPFEIGTDLSGSIRIPAHCCGLFGLKPTEHRVSLVGLIPGLPPLRSVRIMSSIGPMARTVEDLALLHPIIAGPDGRDTDVPPVPIDDLPEIELTNLRIAFTPTFPGFPVAADIRHAIEKLAQQLNRSGAVVEEATLPELDFTQELSSAGELIGMITGAFQPEEHKPPTTLAQYLEALHRRDQSMLAWEQFLHDWDALLCPASMVTAFPHCEPGSSLRVDGQDVTYWMVSAHSTLFNYRTYAVGVLMGGLEGERPPRSSSFGQGAAALPPHLAQKGNFRGGKPPPNPHRVSPVNETSVLSFSSTSVIVTDSSVQMRPPALDGLRLALAAVA